MTAPTNILDAYKRAFKGDPGPPEREDQPPPYRQATAAPEPVADDGYHVADEDDSTADEPTEIYTDVAALLDGELPEPPKPLLLTRTDGHALFYAARVNLLFGDPETGKTWVALAACAEALRDGRRALYVDLDHNGAAAIIRNLLLLGAPKSALRDPDVFRHCEPDDSVEVYQVVADCKVWRPAVAVVDSLGEMLPMLGAASNSPDDYTNANRGVLQPLASYGAAVIAIDHLAQNTASRVLGPTGNLAKRRALGGVSLRVKICRQFTPGKGGSAWLRVNKDRHGGVREQSQVDGAEREAFAGTFVLDPADDDGAIGWRVVAPVTGRSTESLDDKSMQYLDAVRGLSPEWVTVTRAAAIVCGEDPPPAGQKEQARYHLLKLADDGHLEYQKPPSKGAPAKFRIPAQSPEKGPETPFLDDVQD